MVAFYEDGFRRRGLEFAIWGHVSDGNRDDMYRFTAKKGQRVTLRCRTAAGPREWSRQDHCFTSDARQIRTWVDEAGRPQRLAMSLADYEANTTPFFAANAFYEIETARRIDLFGNIAHVWSAYEARASLDDVEPERRGINSIQLFRDVDHARLQ